MATQNELATRILHKLLVLDPQETASAADLQKALEKLRAAHYTLRGQGLVRWTLADIPPEVEEGYVLCGAALAADDYGAPRDANWWVNGMRMVQAFVHVPLSGPSYVENF